MQPEESDKAPSEVSNCFRQRAVPMSVPNVRKRLNALSGSSNLAPDQGFKQLETVADPKSKSGFKTKIYPKGMYSRQDSAATKRSSSRESSDLEGDCLASQRKCEEKSQLICYKDNVRIISYRNDSRLTKYSTFDMNVGDRRGKIAKYKSLDEPKTLVRYLEPRSNVSISAQDFGSDFKFSRRNKHDIITETVDAWARKSSANKGVFSNIKNTLFKNGAPGKEIVFKPLVFGGTFPIDRPEMKISEQSGREKENSRVNRSPVVREYGPAKTFDIDQPI